MTDASFSSGKPVPVDYVLKLRSQGMSDHAVIEQLENEGYSSIDIFEALTKADESGDSATNEMQNNYSQGGQMPPQNTDDIQNFSSTQQNSQNNNNQNMSQAQSQEQQRQQPQIDIKESGMQNNNNNVNTDDIQNFNSQGRAQGNVQDQNTSDIQNFSSAQQNSQNNNSPNARDNPFAQQKRPYNPFSKGSQNNAGNTHDKNNIQSSFLSDLENDNAISGMQNSAGSFSQPQGQGQQRQKQQMGGDAYPNALSYNPKSSGQSYDDASLDKFDEIAEAIIDEKWKELKGYVEKIVEWKSKVEGRIVKIEDEMQSLENQVVGLQKALMQKVQNYDRHITDVATEIKAMEKVFQKIIPSLTDNVTELSSVVSRMKNSQGGQNYNQGNSGNAQQNNQQGQQNNSVF